MEFEREADGRWLAEVSDLPGVMVYGATREEAAARVQALALRVIADLARTRRGCPRDDPALLHRGMNSWPATRARRVLAALLRIGWIVRRQVPTAPLPTQACDRVH